SIDGNIPTLSNLPTGCRFHPRCSFATDICRKEQPAFKNMNGQKSACWHTGKLIEQTDFSEMDSQGKKIGTFVEQKEPLFEITNLSKFYPIKRSIKDIKAVDDV